MAFSAADDLPLLTSDQVMDRLLSDATLRRVAMTCVLPAVRCGTEWRYRKSDLDAWIAEQYLPGRKS
ncbi:MAG TPA: helix-turn-helix domain-containing protein [Vicinamibacterales bacterium]|nr:helix-turn-helix domain-containing protein [Vicinamibacterales bacterium]